MDVPDAMVCAYSSSVGSGHPFSCRDSLRTRYARGNELSRYAPVDHGRGSTKYLMLSSWPYLAALYTQSLFAFSDIFLSSTKYFMMSM